MGQCVWTVYTCVHSVHVCARVCAVAKRERSLARGCRHGAQAGARTQHRAREGAEPGAEHGAMLRAQQLPRTKCAGSRLEPPASRGSDSGDAGTAHLEVGDLGKPLGPSAFPRDEAGQAGAARAPAPDGARVAAGLIDALLTTEATQMINCPRCEGCQRGRRRLCRPPWDSQSRWSLLP